MNTDLATSAGWSAFPGTRRGAAAEGCVTRLPVSVSWDTPTSRDVRRLEPVCWDTQQVRPCSSHGFPTRDGPCKRLQPAGIPRSQLHDGPWKRHRKAGAEVPRGHVANLTTLRRRRASLEARYVTVRQDVSSQNVRRNPFRAYVPAFPMERRTQVKELGGRSLRELALRGSAEEGFASE